MRSIIQNLGTGDFARIRIGAGRPPLKEMLADYVLSKIDKQSMLEIAPSIDKAVSVITDFIKNNGNIQNVNK